MQHLQPLQHPSLEHFPTHPKPLPSTWSLSSSQKLLVARISGCTWEEISTHLQRSERACIRHCAELVQDHRWLKLLDQVSVPFPPPHPRLLEKGNWEKKKVYDRFLRSIRPCGPNGMYGEGFVRAIREMKMQAAEVAEEVLLDLPREEEDEGEKEEDEDEDEGEGEAESEVLCDKQPAPAPAPASSVRDWLGTGELFGELQRGMSIDSPIFTPDAIPTQFELPDLNLPAQQQDHQAVSASLPAQAAAEQYAAGPPAESPFVDFDLGPSSGNIDLDMLDTEFFLQPSMQLNPTWNFETQTWDFSQVGPNAAQTAAISIQNQLGPTLDQDQDMNEFHGH